MVKGAKASFGTRRRMSLAHKGKSLPLTVRKKMSLASRGVPKSLAHRKAMSLSQLGKTQSKETLEKRRRLMTGRKLSFEHRKNIGLAGVGKKRSQRTRENLRKAVKQSYNVIPGLREAKRKIWEKTLANCDVKKARTSIELKLHKELEKRKISFEISKRIGKFSVDIFIAEKKIIIEADGCYWHGCEVCGMLNLQVQEKDKAKNLFFANLGYQVFRFWEHSILLDPSQCIDQIFQKQN